MYSPRMLVLVRSGDTSSSSRSVGQRWLRPRGIEGLSRVDLDYWDPRCGVDQKPEYVRSVVVTDRIPHAAAGQYLVEIEVSDESFLPFADRPVDDGAGRSDDDGVAGFDPVAVFLTVGVTYEFVSIGKLEGTCSACRTGFTPTTNIVFS